MISVDDLIGGGAIALPPKEVYIDALEDTIIIQPVPLERYREYQDASPDKQAECLLRCIAESISQQGGMSIDESRAKVHPEAWNQITTAVMITMFGEEQVRGASGNSATETSSSSGSAESSGVLGQSSGDDSAAKNSQAGSTTTH
jgi:hypothetical protein